MQDSAELQNDLTRLKEWTDKWLIKFNPEKCKLLRIGHKLETQYSIEQDNTNWKLHPVVEEKDLGVWTTATLKSSKHCQESSRKAMNVLRLIKRHFSNLDSKTFSILYKTYVRPHLEYCVQVWSPNLIKDKKCLERVQRRATKLVRNIRKLPYETRLARLGLTTLEKRRKRGDLIETYKLLSGKEKVNKHNFFQYSTNHHLRGHRHKLYKERCRLGVRSHFFSQRVVDDWNRLPEHVVCAETTNCFKNRLDRCNEWGN